ncbi:hypothetical protein NDU88_011621 [Pleurodeles waltl]|uniref:Uncharacterized protein n=1 Tax=Pleurodeles waltl TaxID=8319 RepID=A0AAV7S365_PLEWA|nr:hypothetical protein NDU88_011621 [Pleurodeles waltl]
MKNEARSSIADIFKALSMVKEVLELRKKEPDGMCFPPSEEQQKRVTVEGEPNPPSGVTKDLVTQDLPSLWLWASVLRTVPRGTTRGIACRHKPVPGNRQQEGRGARTGGEKEDTEGDRVREKKREMEREGIYSAREDEDPNCDSHAREERAEHLTGETEEADTLEYEEEGGIQKPLIKPAACHDPGGRGKPRYVNIYGALPPGYSGKEVGDGNRK